MPAASPSFPRILLFAGLLTGVTLLLVFGGLELTLRSIGYGYSAHFARPVTSSGGEKIWRENRWVTAPYFSPELVRRPMPFRLARRKSPGTFRIFVLGSSAAMGDPEPSFSISRTLETMLRAAYPERRFEVINAGITAINSHLVRGIAEDCARLEPDLFIVYEGNNEVIGPFGPAGVFTPFFRREAIVRAAVWLKGTRTGQLIAAVVRGLHHGKNLPADWGGMQMFLQQQIAVDDPRLDAVRSHFKTNLLAIADAAHAVGAHTLICTVATNQRDFAPFLSQHRPTLKSAELARWRSAFTAAEKLAAAGDLAAAERSYRAALAIDGFHAELVFKLGRLLLQTGHLPEAQVLLQRALDLDTLRFRTDSSLNQVIRSLAVSPGHDLEVVDLATALAARSTGGLIGDDLLYEHVHPTLRGTYEIASELLPHVIAQLTARGGASPSSVTPLDYSEVRLRLGFTTHEQAMIALELLNRFKAPPFNAQADHASRLATWQRRAETAETLLARPDALPSLREIYQRALTNSPHDWILARNAGAMFVARQAPTEAVPLLERARGEIDDDVDTLVALGWAQRALGHSAESASAFAQVRLLEPRYPGLPSSDAAAKP